MDDCFFNFFIIIISPLLFLFHTFSFRNHFTLVRVTLKTPNHVFGRNSVFFPPKIQTVLNQVYLLFIPIDLFNLTSIVILKQKKFFIRIIEKLCISVSVKQSRLKEQ